MPCSIPRWTEQVLIGFFPARAAFPGYRAGRRPRLCFRGLLKLHSRYSLQTCGPPNSGPLSRGFDLASYPTKPLGSYHANRQLHGWILPPLEICAIGAHVESRKGARPGPNGSRWFPFPARQTGRAQLEHPAFRLASPTTPTKAIRYRAPCDSTPDKPSSRCDNSRLGPIRNCSGFQTCVNDRSVALSPAHQK
jgi:hypothetical protein